MKATDQKQYARDLKEITRDIRRLGGIVKTMKPATTGRGRAPQIEALFDGVASIPGCKPFDRTPKYSARLDPEGWRLKIQIPIRAIPS